MHPPVHAGHAPTDPFTAEAATEAHPAHIAHHHAPHKRQRRRKRLRAATYFAAACIGLGLLLVGGLVARMLMGPVVLEGLSGQVGRALGERLGPRWTVTVGTAVIEHAGFNPALRVGDVEIRNPDGQRALKAPSATVSVDPWALVAGRFVPRSIKFVDLDLRLSVRPDGTLAFRAGAESDGPQPGSATPTTAPALGDASVPPEPGAPPVGLTRALSRAMASAVELLTENDGVFGGLDEASVVDARLTFLGPDGRVRYQFGNVSLNFERPKDSLRRFKFGLSGASGRWQMEGTVAGRAGAPRFATIAFQDIPVADLLVLGSDKKAVTTNMPLSGTIGASLDADGRLTTFDTSISGGQALIYTDDPDLQQFEMDGVRLATSFEPATDTVLIKSLYATWDGSHVQASGRLEPGDGAVPWRLRLDTTDALAAPATPRDAAVVIDRASVVASGVAGGGVVLEKAEVAARGGLASVSGEIGTEAARRGVRMLVTGERSDIRTAFTLWPAFAARGVRDFLTDNVRSGFVERLKVAVDMSAADILEARARRPLPAQTVQTEVVLSSAEYVLGGKLPVIRGAASANVSARTAKIDISKADLVPERGRTVAMPSGTITIGDTAAPLPIAIASVRLTSNLDALIAMVRDAGMTQVQVEPGSIQGQADVQVGLTVPLAKVIPVERVQATARGTVTGLTVERVAGKERLQGGDFTVNLDRTSFTMKGDGQLAGLPVDVDVRQPLQPGVMGEATLTLSLDDAARAKLGMSMGPQVAGPIAVKVVAPLARTDGANARVDLDLSKTRLDGLLPGWSKPAGRPGRVTFQLVPGANNAPVLDDFVLDAGGLVVKGTVQLNADNGFEGAKLTTVKLSSADDMRVDVDRVGQTLKIAIKGSVIDARPFIKQLVGDEAGNKPTKAAKPKGKIGDDFDIDVTTAILAGFNGESLTGATLKIAKRGDDIKQLSLAGRFGRQSTAAQLTPRDRGSGVLQVKSNDAGAMLRFLDLYKRMSGGTLTLQAAMGEGRQSGSLDIGNFALRDEPALRRIVSVQPVEGRINADDVAFTGLHATFNRTAARIDLQDGIIWGPQVGIKLDGSVDFARDRVDLAGTFIPAYALNNAFSRIPLVGPILGGGSNEGVFAVSFRITGPASGPTLTVNPLTAVAPGIFRKFLEVFTPDGSARGAAAPAPQTLGDR